MVDRARNLGQIVMGLNRAQQRLMLAINQALAAEGLNMTRLNILSRFTARPNNSLTVGAIVANSGIKQPTVTKAVAWLIEQGWLVHHPDPADARKKVLKISPEGLGAVIRAYGKITPLLHERFQALDDDQVAQVLEGVDHLNRSLDQSWTKR